MFDYSIYALYKFFRHPQITGEPYMARRYDKLTDIPVKSCSSKKPHNAVLNVVVTIQQWDKGRDRQIFLDWLNVGCKQMSDGAYEIEET